MSLWQPIEGQSFNSQSSTPQVLLATGQDDAFYMLFRSVNNTNTSVTIISPTLTAGQYKITFWYAMPGPKGLLNLETIAASTHAKTPYWNQTNTGPMNWTHENCTFKELNNFSIAFTAYEEPFGFIGLDSIQVCRACETLRVEHASVRYDNSTATFICGKGYNLDGDSQLTCSQWQWNSTTPVCQPLDCGQFKGPVNSIVSTDLTTFGSMVNISCEAGYTLFGQETATCGEDGKWKNTSLECVLNPVFNSVPEASCTFTNKTPCTFNISSQWVQAKGRTEFELRLNVSRTLSVSGQDDEFYLMFWSNATSELKTSFIAASPVLPAGLYQITFWYIVPVSTAHVTLETATADGTDGSIYWDYIDRKPLTWENTTVYINERNSFMLIVRAYDKRLGFVGIDNIEVFSARAALSINCGRLPVPANGITLFQSTTFGSVSTITCDTGYNLNGSYTSVCGSNGKWSTAGHTCTLVDCKRFPIPAYGIVYPTSTSYGTVVTITCDTGYNLNGSSTSSCGSYGNWSNTDQTCILVECGPLPDLLNGTIDIDDTTLGSTANFTCNEGFNLTGSTQSVCTSNGVWNATGQACYPVDCGSGPTLPNGKFVTNNTTFGSVAILHCNEGYNLTGSQYTTCNSSAMWNTTNQTCTLIDCGLLPTLVNGTVYTKNTTFGSVAVLTCDEGFNLTGNGLSVCGSTGIWNTKGQICDIVDCGPFPKVHRGTVQPGNTTFGSVAVLQCDEGFNLTGSKSSVCTGSAIWNSTGQTCTPIDCGILPDPLNGTVNVDNTTFESVAVLTCDDGFNLIGSNYSICTGSGVWNTTGQICDPIDCGTLPALKNGTITYVENTTFGSIAVLTCYEGFYLTGDSFSACNSSGIWNVTNQTCNPVECGPLPPLLNGRVYAHNTTFGSLAVLTCNEGFNLTGENYSMCSSSAVWNITGQACFPIDCGSLPSLLNGTIVYTENKTFGSVAILTCEDGFQLTGNNYSACTSRGIWNSTGQSCNLKDCGAFPTLLNGTITYNDNTTFGSVAVLKCDEGFHLTGNNYSECTSSGTWNSTDQICNPIDCGPFPILRDGTAYTENTTFGSIAVLTCEDGFTLTGDSYSICTRIGIWNSTEQTCNPIDCGPLPKVVNGTIVYFNNTTIGSVAVVTCDEGFNLTGNSYSECSSSGIWNSTGQTCNLIDCGAFFALMNGSVDTKYTTFGSIAVLTCDEGFNLTGNSYSECTSSGIWNSTGQTCNPVDCGPFTVLINGAVYTENTTFGSIAVLTCNDGFNLFGNSYSECTSSGIWNSTGQTCNPIDCGPFPALINGTVYTDNTTLGSIAVLTCDDGFNLFGNSYSECNRSGIWNSTGQTCSPIDCGPLPVLMNGSVDTKYTTFGSIAVLTCDEGFNLTGNRYSVCTSSGIWNSTGQICSMIDCGPFPVLFNGSVYIENTTFGSIAVLTCDEGFNLTDRRYSACNGSGIWNVTGQMCRPIDCGSLDRPRNGTLTYKATTFESVVTVTCDTGYNVVGNNTSECIHSGTWSNTKFSCEPIDCGPLIAPLNGFVVTTDRTYGTASKIKCSTGYQLIGNDTSYCGDDGNWTYTNFTCTIIDCGPPDGIPNGALTYNATTFGSSVTCTCDIGHKLTGRNTAECLATGSWSTPHVTCTSVDCGPLKAPLYGYLNCTDTIYGAVAEVTCSNGYLLSGNDTTYCGSDGNWTHSNFTCNIIDCGPIQLPPNGTISGGATTFGTTVNITCVSGYDLVGYSTSECLSSGNWSNTMFDCKPIDCGPPPNASHAIVNILSLTLGSVGTITCDNGFTLVGANTTECASDGSWINSNYKCTLVDCGPPTVVTNGKMYYSATVFQSTATVTCNDGYVLSETNTTTVCSSTGSWSVNEFKCNPVDCGNLTTRVHQQITYAGSKTTFGTLAIMVCDIGYTINNRPGVRSEVAACNASGMWSIAEFSICDSIVCPLLNLSDGAQMDPTIQAPYKANTVVHFKCQTGLTLSGFNSITCLSSGEWSGKPPNCIKENIKYSNCPKIVQQNNITWEETSPGGIQSSTCPDSYIGVISRTCSTEGVWLLPVDGCVRKEIETISAQVEAIKSNPTQESITDSLNKLSNVTSRPQTDQGENQANTVSKTTSGELQKVTNILDMIVNASAKLEVTTNQVEKFLDTTSNLLDASNTDSWKSVDQNNDNKDKNAVQVLNVVDRYIGVISKSLSSMKNESIEVKTTNLVMQVSRIGNNTTDMRFPSTQSAEDIKSAVFLPKSSLGKSSAFSVVVYKNLSGILSSNTVENNSDAKSEISSEVVAVTLDNWQSNSDFNISLTLGYFQASSGEPRCKFWNITRSAWDSNGCILESHNSNSSTCVCNHLTNFAILMSPWIENVDTVALDVISIVGCSVSMLGLIITITVHVYFWRYVKSDRVVILIHLSVALILSYAVFIGGVNQTENKAVCTAIAIILQYIYLVVFFLMLAEGIEIGITVIYVFVTKSRLKWILPAAWVLPAVIVGISMGATQLMGYGNTKFCWLSLEGGLIWAFVAPATLIILVNFVVLMLVIKKMFRSKTLSEKSRSERSRAGVRCLCVLLPLMGCTWVIGLLYVNESMAWVQYVFAVCNSLQGLVIFVLHCVLNVQIRNALQRRKDRKHSKSFISTNSASFVSTRVSEDPVALPRINLSSSKDTDRGSRYSAVEATSEANGPSNINTSDTLF